MQYSLAVVRMVNGIADSSQKGRVAASVASLASAAGLPRLLVDLRHEATHNELPSLPALQLAAHHALDWLRTYYWQRQREHVDVNRTKISTLVGDYVASHMAAANKAAAAAAAAAQLPEDSGSSDEAGPSGTPAAASSGDYNVAAARKRRQSLLTELRVAVPRPAAGLLIDGLLQAHRAASLEAPAAVVKRALTHAMKHLQEGWPQIPLLLLESAALGLSPSSSGNAATTSHVAILESKEESLLPDTTSAFPETDWGLWLEVLTPPNGGGILLPENAARSILATTLTSFSAHAQSRLLRWASGDTSPSTNGSESKQIAALHTLLDVALRHVSDPVLEAKCRLLVASYETEGAAGTTVGGSGISLGGGDQGTFPGSNPQTGIATTSVHQSTQVSLLVPKESGKRKREKGGIDNEGYNSDTASTPRWKISKEWLPCAIGMIPHAVDPNGRLPCLDIASRAASEKAAQLSSGEGEQDNVRSQHAQQEVPAARADVSKKGGMGINLEGIEDDNLVDDEHILSVKDLVMARNESEKTPQLLSSPHEERNSDERPPFPGRCPPPAAVLPFI